MSDARRVKRELTQALREFADIAARPDDPRVRRLDGLGEIHRVRDELTDGCQSRTRAIHSSPPLPRNESHSRRIRDVAQMSERGVVQQSLSPPERLAGQTSPAYLRALTAVGDDLRAAEELPIQQMLAYDQTAALVPVPGVPTVQAALLVRDAPLLRPIHRAFDVTWQRAVRLGELVPDSTGREVSGRQQEILSLLSSGLSDAVIARHLRVTDRTIRREIARLCRIFGVDSRFQLGVVAARYGLV
ncbi:MAG: hypothetical protein GEU93_01855 [Propionibacteriales bacterium]|nr:hypothetical protein [Propionibacteriales bacterium]